MTNKIKKPIHLGRNLCGRHEQGAQKFYQEVPQVKMIPMQTPGGFG